jgi:carbamate kinase
MKIVIALGGNALLRRGEPLTEEVQRRNAQNAGVALSRVAKEHQVVVTHGNGPQVGLLALESEAYKEVPPYGLAVLGAESQGMIGFLLQQALRSCLPNRCIATVLTTVLVQADDPAMTRPTKPIGPIYPADEARQLSSRHGWLMRQDSGGYRRLVPSPMPIEVLELPAIQALTEAGVVPICAGGGGVPLVRQENGELVSADAVVDKDFTSALLAEKLAADTLLLLTDVEAVERGWNTRNTPAAETIREASVSDMRSIRFEDGSMGPKVEAACRFVEHTGHRAVIGALSQADAMLQGNAGTLIFS